MSFCYCTQYSWTCSWILNNLERAGKEGERARPLFILFPSQPSPIKYMWLHSLNLSFWFFFGLGGKRGGFFFINLAINLHPARWKPFALPPSVRIRIFILAIGLTDRLPDLALFFFLPAHGFKKKQGVKRENNKLLTRHFLFSRPPCAV